LNPSLARAGPSFKNARVQIAGLALCLGSGCAATSRAAEPMVRVQAERDLDCPNDDIRVEEELGGRYKAVGCGRKAYYRSACEGLTCEVRPAEDPAIPWRDRPEP
jgi:hypothetical protein